MPKQNTKTLTDEQMAIRKYYTERKKASDIICKQMNKQIRSDNIKGGLLGGAALGIVVGALIGDTHARVPIYNTKENVVEYSFDANKLCGIVLQSITIALIATLAVTQIKTKSDIDKNHFKIDKKIKDLYTKYFNKSIKSIGTLGSDVPCPYVVYTRAAALIINNMPESEIARLRAFATSCLIRDKDGNYTIQDKYIDTAAQIISNFINYNPALKNGVQDVLRGDHPQTYFLTQTIQNTR